MDPKGCLNSYGTVCLTSIDHPLIEGASFSASTHAIDSIFDLKEQFTDSIFDLKEQFTCELLLKIKNGVNCIGRTENEAPSICRWGDERVVVIFT